MHMYTREHIHTCTFLYIHTYMQQTNKNKQAKSIYINQRSSRTFNSHGVFTDTNLKLDIIATAY